ncbi:MAG: acylneuraminate cytidylyltransferase family protein [Gammaproteobacteria bacterium]
MRASIAFIPARGGSKRFPGKALAPFRGRSLIVCTIETALASGCFTRIVVSSDAEPILAEASRIPGTEARWRPAALGSDLATTMDVLVDFLTDPYAHRLYDGSATPNASLSRVEGRTDVALMQPTCPLLQPEDVRRTVSLLGNGIDAAVSVVAVSIPPEFCFPVDERTGICEISPESALVQGRTRKQAHRQSYTPNGAIYASTVDGILARRSFFKGAVAAYRMPRERSVDIDERYDLELAEFLGGRLEERDGQ